MFLPCPGRGVGVVRTEVRKWMRCSQTLCLCLSGSHGDERHLCGQFGEDGGTENWTSSCRRLGGRMYNQGSRGSGYLWLAIHGAGGIQERREELGMDRLEIGTKVVKRLISARCQCNGRRVGVYLVDLPRVWSIAS